MKIVLSVKISILLIFLTGSFSFAAQPEEIQAAITARGARWFSGETSVSRLSPEEKRMRVGLIKPTHAEDAALLSGQETEPRTGLAPSLDWRNNGGNLVTPVRNQGSCGSCWAFAATAALESALLRSGVPVTGLDKSEQVLVSCGNSGSCAGGYISYASDFIRNTGLPTEACYPYTGVDGTCSNACSNWQASASRINSWTYVTTTSTTVTVNALKNGLNSFGPLVTTMNVYADFFNYTSGIYSHVSGSYQGGHAILLVGYDEPGQYFILKNSWGAYWGEAGYFRIAYSEVDSVVNFGDWTIAYYPSSADATPPTVTGFVIPSTATSRTINITTFTATDNVGVSGYMLTESATAPSSAATGWSATAPTTYTFAAAGTKTLYAWAKDAAGNVSVGINDTVTITLPPPPSLDLLWQHQTTGTLAAWLMNGTTQTSGVLLTPSVVGDPNWKIVGVGDFNADGKPDLLWQHQTTGTLAAWLMNGTTQTSSVALTPSGVADANWKIVAVRDFDGDGKPDILWKHQTTGALGVWLMNGTTATSGVALTPSVVGDPNWKVVGTMQ